MRKEYLAEVISSDSARWADELQSGLNTKSDAGWELFAIIRVRMSQDERRILHDCVFTRNKIPPRKEVIVR